MAAPPAVVVPSSAQAQASATLPPARTYYNDAAGRRAEVKERWDVDASGERHGSYMKFNRLGLVLESATYIHGSQTGPGVYYRNWVDNFYNPLQKRPDTKFSGSYKNGVRVGAWLAYKDDTKEHIATDFYDANGALRRRTLFRKGQPVEIGEQDANGNLVQTTFIENGKARVVTAQQQQAQAARISASAYQKQEEENAKQAIANAKQAEVEAKAQASRDAEAARRSLLNSFNKISFGTDSYVLTAASKKIVEDLAAYVNAQALAKSPIPTIFVSVHTKRFNDKRAREATYNPKTFKREARAASDVDAEQKMLYVLTLNRACTIKTMLLEKLNDKTTNIITYGCGGSLGNDDIHTNVKAEMPRGGFIISDEDATIPAHVNISLTQDLPIARDAALALSQQFKLPSSPTLIANEVLKANILKTIRAYWDNQRVRNEMVSWANSSKEAGSRPEYFGKIPSELWLTNLSQEVPGAYTQVEGTERFKGQVMALFAEMNRKYDLGSGGQKEVKPEVLFTMDLESRVR